MSHSSEMLLHYLEGAEPGTASRARYSKELIIALVREVAELKAQVASLEARAVPVG